MRSPDPSLEELLAELESYLPALPPQTEITSFTTAADFALAEPHLDAFRPADERTAEILRRRWG